MRFVQKRRIWFVIFYVFWLLQIAEAEDRLSINVKPQRYEILWRINLDRETFSGEEKIDVTIASPTDAIVLHAFDLELTEAKLSQNTESFPVVVRFDRNNKMITMKMNKTISSGKATLYLKWNGTLRNDLRGFYLAQSEGHRYALTQFYPGDARKAFPCFDEPAFKAHFSITTVIPENLKAISNGKVLEETMDPASHTKTVRFSETALISSYLVAVAVGPYEAAKAEAGRIPITVWTPPGKAHLAQYSLEVAQQMIPIFEEYFGLPYAFEKLDLIVAPEFQHGAMENAAAIFFRDSTLLVDKSQASVSNLKRTAGTLAHEIAHQWFGDLITMSWWDDLWLSESFADWMSDKVVEIWKPEWNVSSYSVISKARAMKVDALRSTHAIRVHIESPEQANQILDAITYAKGASILRMLESWLGESVFRTGIRKYVREHQFGNTTADDLWSALEQASGHPVVAVGKSWTDQPGFPIVSLSVTQNGEKRILTARQQRYLGFAESSEKGVEQLWLIPICIQYRDGSKQKQQCVMLSGKEKSFTLGAASWIYGNAKEVGYYYVQHDPKLLADLLGSVALLMPQERAGLLGSEWAGIVSGLSTVSEFMPLLYSYKDESEGVVIQRMTEILELIYRKILDDDASSAWRKFVQELLNPLWQELTWTPGPGETDAQKLLRAQVLQTLTEFGHPENVMAEMDRKLELYLQDPSTLDASLISAVVHAAATLGDRARYEEFLQHMKQGGNPQDLDRFLLALPLFENPELAKRTLELAVNVQPPVSKDDASEVIRLLFQNRSVRNEIWKWTHQNWPDIRKNVTPFFQNRILESAAELCDPQSRQDFADFFQRQGNGVSQSKETLNQSVESMDSCIDLKNREQQRLTSWLMEHYR